MPAPVHAVSGHHHIHTPSRLSVLAPCARRRRMSVCGNGSHPRPDAKSLQAADSGRGGQEPAGHHCAPSAAVSAPPRCGVMWRKGGARERERERTLVCIESTRCDQQGGGTRTCSVHPKTVLRERGFRLGFVHHCPRPRGSGLYHYALILYHLTTASKRKLSAPSDSSDSSDDDDFRE